MVLRRHNVPWIHKKSRFIIGAIAIIGLILTSYLTISKLMGEEVACTIDAINSASGCTSVLDSPWAYPLDPVGKTGPPLSLFGAFGYISMATFALAPLFINPDTQKQLRQNLEQWTWWLLLAGSFAMATFSAYLMYVLAFKLQMVCYYCIGSALFSLSLLTLSIIGHDWEDMGQIFFTGIAVSLITLVGALGVYANADQVLQPTQEVAMGEQIVIPHAEGEAKPPIGWEITTESGQAEIELAKHLTEVGVVNYSAFWCPHCYDQKQLFGKEAFSEINMVECDGRGKNGNPQKCIDAQVKAFPTWVIDGKVYQGVQSLDKLADLTGYTGDRNFKYKVR